MRLFRHQISVFQWLLTGGAGLGLAALSGCLAVDNSSSSDAIVYGTVDSSRPHITILTRKCAPCHDLGGFDHAGMSAWTDAEFVSNGWVFAGDSTNSNLYKKITGNLGSLMPPATSPYGAVTDAEKAVIADWIDNLTL